ncbi:MAG: RHS repeat protein [Planctomycetes bacterium]|nr:RHS repeat protein [Planctomycetota bacterium]
MRNLAIAAILTFASVPLCAAPLYMGARDADPAVPHRNAAEVAPGIRLANGSFSWEQTDLTTAGRVMGLSMRRVYRSDMDFDGPLGQGWTGEYFQAAWLDPASGDIKWHDADGFLHTFIQNSGAFVSPPGVYARASWDAVAEAVQIRLADGTVLEFTSGGQLRATTDRHGNSVNCQYDTNHRLSDVIDDRGYSWEFSYDTNGRIVQLIDHVWETSSRAARVVDYAYDTSGRLIAVSLPETARYNDANLNRVSWAYAYDAAGHLCEITAPNEVLSAGPPRIELEYDNAERVVEFRDGHASGWHALRYISNSEVGVLARHIDARGVRTDITVDSGGRASRLEQYTGYWAVDETLPLDHSYVVQTGAKLRSADPDKYVTTSEFNSGHERIGVSHPGGNGESFGYPDANSVGTGTATSVSGTNIWMKGAKWAPGEFVGGYVRVGAGLATYAYYEVAANSADTLTVVGIDLAAEGWAAGAAFTVFTENPDPLAAGNLLEHRQISADSGQADIVRSWTYEPYFQQVRSETSARGHVTSYEYGFDTSGDPADGDLTFGRSPAVTVLLRGGSSESVIYETAFTWNSYGQLTGKTDPEGSVEARHYYATGDASGFLEDIVRDSGGLELTERFEYDKTGILTGQYSPRAFEAGATADDFKTSWEVNELAQPWHESGPVVAAGQRVDVYRYFDASGNEVRTWREYVTADGTAPDVPTNANDPESFSKSAVAMSATWVEARRTFDTWGRLLTETTDVVAGTPVETATREFEYDELGYLSARISPLLNRNVLEYDERGLLWRRTEGAGSSVEGVFEFDYDTFGGLAAERTPLGNETLHVRDGHGREVSTIDPAGHHRDSSFDASGNLVGSSCIDAGASVLDQSSFVYDEIERRVAVDRTAKDDSGTDIGVGHEERCLQLDGCGRVVASCDGPGRTSTFTYDGAGRLTGHEDAAGNQLNLQLDAEGNPTQASYSDFNQLTEAYETATWEADYNTLGCIVAVRDRRYFGTGLDTESSFEWDGWGRLISESRAGGMLVSYAYDVRSRPTGREESDTVQLIAATSADWDRDDRTLSTGTDHQPNPLVTSFEYDARDRVRLATRPDDSEVILDYDADSRLISRTDETGTEVTQGYNERGLLVSRTVDPAGGTRGVTEEEFEYDGAGRLVLCESSEDNELIARAEWTWNTLGRRETCTQTLGNGNGGTLGQWLTEARFDVHGSAVEQTFSDATSLSVTQDELSRVVSISDAGASLVLADCLWSGPDRLVRRNAPNGVATSISYEAGDAGPIARVAHTRGSETLWGVDRLHDERGLPVRERRDHDGGTGNVLTFDGLHRFTQVTSGAALAGAAFVATGDPTEFGLRRSFGIDASGNRNGTAGESDTASDESLVAEWSYSQANGSSNQYELAGNYLVGFDAAGRTTSDSATGMFTAWDFRGRQVVIDDSSDFSSPLRHSFYDALGRPVLEVESDSTGLLYQTILIYGPDGDAPVEEIRLDQLGAEISRVQYALGPTANGPGVIAEKSGGVWRFHHEDQDGSLIGLTAESGLRVAEYDYLPFGTPVRRTILLDVAPAGIASVDEDTPTTGVTRITLNSASLVAGTLVGRELAVAVPTATTDQYRAASVAANSTDTIEFDDATGSIADAILNEGAGFVIRAARLALGAPAWTYDSLSDSSKFTVSGADFGGWLLGGQLTPDVTRPAYLEIIEVDSNGDWLRVRGDATAVSGSTDCYRVVPPVGLSEEDGSTSAQEGRYLFRGWRYEPAVGLADWTSGVWASRCGQYLAGGRTYDPRIGRALTPADIWRNEYEVALWGTLDTATPPTVAPAIAGTALPSPSYSIRPAGRPEFRCVGPGSRGWFE